MKLIFLLLLLSIAASQQCSTCIQQCGPNGKCLGCESGFFLDNTGACGRFTPIEDCQTYDSQTGKCSECYQGNILQYGICQQMIQNCKASQTNNTDVCSQCNNTYVLVDDIHCYSGKIDNCTLGSLPRKIPSGQAFCQKFQRQKCSISSQDVSYCKVCEPGYFNINGVCFSLINQASCPSNNCNCQYYYKDNVCYQFLLEGCLQSKDKLYCDLCNDTLINVNGRCFEALKSSDIHCNVMELNRDVCSGCNFQYTLDPNYICVKTFSLCSDPNKTCQAQCTHSSLLFYDGNCYVRDQQCISYDTAKNKCTKCFEGYTLSSDFKCERKQKCWIYAADGKTCQKCFTEFQLNTITLTCNKLPYNCKQANNAGTCLTCSSYTELITQTIPVTESFSANLSIASNATVCIYTTSNCQYYNIFGFCQICKTSYVQKSHQCLPMASNCKVSSDTDKSKCQVCNSGYDLDNSTLACFPKIQGCLQYSSTKTCIKCTDGYTLRNGLCFFRDANCLQFGPKGNCMRCGNSLIPYYNKCVFYDPFCSDYDNNGFCIRQFGGFSQNGAFSSSMQTNYKSFIAYARNIQQSSGSSSASSSGNGVFTEMSIFGGYFTPQGWIRVLPTTGLYNERISQYDVNGKVRSCRDGYTLINGDCVMKIDYCKQYSSSNGLCIKPNPFYHMGIGRKCVPTTKAICLISTSTGEACSKCASSYVLVGGQCFWAGLNVIEYSANSTVKTVESGYFIWVKNNIAWPYDVNCVSQTQPGKCLQCVQQSAFTQSGMRNVDGKCIIVKQNCAKYNARGICESCLKGYFLYYGLCNPSNCLTFSPTGDNCLTCPSLFTYEAGLCVNKIQPNCIAYDQITSFNASTTKTILCKYCASGYYLKLDNSCQKMIINCQLTDSQSGRCTQCITGYIIYEQTCIKEIVGCQTYNRSSGYSTCTQCIANYNLLNNQCFTLPPRCQQLNSSGACSKCQTGYVPIMQGTDSICIFVIQNCVLYNRQGRCTGCAKNYVLQKNLCNFFISGCLQLGDGVCNKCLEGYYLRNGYCIFDAGCIAADNGVCTQCIDGYRLVNGYCVKNTIDNCLTQKDDDCLQCVSGYGKIVLFGKVYCILKRIIYSGCTAEQYPCVKCQSGFQLRDDGFCYAQQCLYQLTRFSLRTCTACYPYYKLDPSNSFCVLYNCNSPVCYDTKDIPQGFRKSTTSGFLIEINYCSLLQDDYSCRQCANYRYPNLLVQWNLCYPSNCKSNQMFNCSGNCYNYFGNNVVGDNSVCVADNCQVIKKDGTCETCIKPYNVINGICLNQGPCLEYNPATSQCKICRQGYNLMSGSCIPKNCTSYSPTDVSICLQCQRGYQLTSSKICELKYCQYPGQTYPCTQCITGFYFSTITNLCMAINCNSFDYVSNKCQQCQPQYKLVNDTCILQQCSTFNYITWKCAQCITGYKLNANGLCVLDNCCSFNGAICSQCCSGYDYIQGFCRSRCEQFNTQNICITCRVGYKLNSNKQCVTQIQGCTSYNTNICVQCQVGLILVNGRCIPKYCNNYTQANPTFCIQCHPRFYQLNSGLCYPKNCINFNSVDWTCQQCEATSTYSFSLIQNASLCFTDKCSAYQLADYVCRQCQTNGINTYKLQTINASQICVLECGLYYELVNAQCKLKYCSNYYPNGKCLTCAAGYELQQSTGYCKLKYCLNYNQQNCVTCSNGFVLDPVNKKYCVPNNCQNYNIGSQSCQNCQQGFVQEYNLCVLRNCYVYNSQYVCQKCLQGFILTQVNSTLLCMKSFNSTCPQGYYFSQNRGYCQPISIQYCSYVNPSTPSSCLSCFPNYFLYQGICYSIDGCQSGMFSYIYGCKQCIKGFKLQSGNICVRDICDQYQGNSTLCKNCVNGYFLINGTCVSYNNFCVSGNIYQGCVTCQFGYQVVNGICRKLPDNCAYINLSLDCIQCASGYFLYNGICYKTIPNCPAQRASYCDKCDTLYVISNDQTSCISKQPIRYCQQHDSTFDFCLICLDGFIITTDRKCLADHCSKYDLQTYVCKECANQTINGANYYYTLRNDRCNSISISYCAVPLNQTACKVCLEGYYLDNGMCKASNCQVYKNNMQQCSTCINGFYLTTNGICRKYPDNCQVVNQNGLCTVCLSGFTLNSNGFCVKGTQFCGQYNNDGICISCQQGYYLTGARVCTKLPDNCLNSNLLGQCLQCVDPFVLSGAGVCYRLVANCSRYNDLGSCIGCNNGFYLTSYGSCLILPDNCMSASSTGVCRQCASGFRLENGMCIKQIANCGIYQNSSCIACATNYYLINGQCYKLPNYCTMVNQQSQCLQCMSSYTLYKGFCYLNVQFCQAYSPLGDCNLCIDGYYVNSAARCTPIPVNCNKVNLNGICLECASGFVLSNGLCYREVSYCLAYNQSTNLCRQCISGYYLIDGKCYRLPQNCLSVNTQSNCITCSAGYILQNSLCYMNLPYCQAYASNGICSRCVTGYYLTNTGTCTTLPEGCSNISGSQGCSSCITGYVLQGGICYKEYLNCFLYDQSTKQCRQCATNYILMNGFCYQLPSNCLSIDYQRQCTSCASGYVLQAGICYNFIQNCIAYSGNSCIQCSSGYYVNFGSCVLLPINCIDVAQNGTCLRCIDGYFTQNGICYKFDKNCIAYNATSLVCRACADGCYLNYQYICMPVPVNCLAVNTYGNCTSCKTNFTSINGLCYPTIPQCDNWNLTTMLCAKCINGFFLRDGHCYRTVDNCAIYSPTNFNCIKCIDNYILTNNLCITCSDGYYVDNYGQCRPNPINCKVSNQYGQCLQCQPSFTIINGFCTQEILYCQNYNQNNLGQNICTQCFFGYYMKDQFTCLRLPNGCAMANSTGFCLQCFEGYAVNSNGICYTVIAYCQTYQLATGLCLECIQNYYLNINQTCAPMLQNNCLFANSMGQCIQCVQSYVLVSSTCYPAIPYCYNHSTSSYTCLQCIQGYYLFNRTCYKIPSGCNNVVNNLCTSCQQGYQLSNGLCQLIDDTTCLKYQLISGYCLQCKAGFYLSANSMCVRVPQYCSQANNQGQCLTCISGYVLSNGICYKEIPNCARWGSGNCIQCIDQYYLQNGLCYKYPDYCQTFDTLTLSCLKCITGYQLSFGRCVINLSTNCLYYNPLSTSQCYTCKNTFYEYWVNPSTGEINSGLMTVDNFCKPYPEFCTNVDLLGNCISCCFGSRLDNSRCVGTSLRSLNCDLFDSVNLKCLKCMTGYIYCDWLAICIEINLNCLTYNSLQQCIQCADGFQLLNNDCVKPAPGVSSTNSALCNTGYTYSTLTEYGNAAGSCFRNKNQLIKISTFGQYSATQYRPGQTLNAQPFNSGVYNPPSYINNYLSISTTKPQIIHYIQIKGTSNGYVTHYLIQYRNKDSSPFICWNSCQKIRANVNGNDVAELKLTHPIVASQLRIYPLKWVGGIWMTLQMLVESQ